MAELIAWSQGPAKALGRFEVRTPPKTLDEMYSCAANEAERAAIHQMQAAIEMIFVSFGVTAEIVVVLENQDSGVGLCLAKEMSG